MKRKTYAGWGFALFFGLGTFWAWRGSRLLLQRAHYTIGYLTGWRPMPKSGIYYNFRFTVAGTAYVGSSSGEAGMATADGTRIVVKYDSLDPASNVGYFRLVIPDSIRQPPPNGWRHPPFPIPQWILDLGKESGR